MHVFYKFLFIPDFDQSRHRLNFKNSLSTSFLDYWIVLCFGCCFWVYFLSFSFQRNGMAPSLPGDFLASCSLMKDVHKFCLCGHYWNELLSVVHNFAEYIVSGCPVFFSGPSNQFNISLEYIDMLFCWQITSVHILFMH